MSWKLAIFDWDGTLVDSRENAYRGATAIFEHYGVPVPSYAEFLRDTNSDYARFYHKYGIPAEVGRPELNAIWKPVFKNSPHPPLREHAIETVQMLRSSGLKTAIVSGNLPELLEAQAAHLGIRDEFEYILADACGKKSELAETLRRFALNPHEAFYIDDTFEGLSVAKSLGISAIALEGGFNTREEMLAAEPDHLISSLEDLPLLLKEKIKSLQYSQ